MTRPDLDIDLGDGARLRSLSIEEVGSISALVEANRDRLDRWFPWVELGPQAQRTWLESAIANERSAEGNGIFLDGTLVGNAGLSVEALEDNGEIGYWLAEGYEGRGLVTRACIALMDLGFADRGLHRIQIKAATDNVRSRAVCERLGLKREGVLRGAGRVGGCVYKDLVVYAVLAAEWASREP